MDLEVVGRHAMLFDDDGMAAFVNSAEALVDWNSLSIDRYDVRHLLPGPIPPRLKRRPPPPPLEADLDLERYLDLPSSSSDEQPQDNDSDQPPNEKVHQIIARTAVFVSKHGSQSEIILRVKQGDNPTFGFLMPDHHLHKYFRFLVDHQELLNGESSVDKNKSQECDQTGGALSLLGSVYGSGEDEDGATESTSNFERNKREEASASPGTLRAESSSDAAQKDGGISKNPISSLKEKVPVIKRNHSISTVKTATATRAKTSDALDSASNAANKSQTVPTTAKIELPVVEPPPDLKRVIEKIVEFILKNGKQFEAVLAEQDRAHGRFPFLLPSNRYHTYYLKVLQTAEESKLPGKGNQKHNTVGRPGANNTAVYEESDNLSFGSMGSDLPYDTDRKEKFKMIIGKSKKDGQDLITEDNQSQNPVTMDAAAAAAILQAATRGIKNPNLELLTKTSSGSGQGLGSDGGHLSSSGSHYSSQSQGFAGNPKLNADAGVSAPVAKAIAETVAKAAAGEADSSEAHMSKEQKLKAERLKRAKMFAAMLKSGVGALKTELPRALSVDPPGSGLSGSDAETGNLMNKEREGSSVPLDADNSDKTQKTEEKLSVHNSDKSDKSEEMLTVDNNERRSKRSYRSRSSRHEEEENEEEEENREDKRDHKRSRKKHRSRRSTHGSLDKHKHKRRHSSSKDKYSHKGTEHDSSDDERRHSRHHHKYDSSSDEKHHSSKRRYREDSMSNHKHRHSRHSSKPYSSSDDEHRHRSRNIKHKSRSHGERETDLEEGEIFTRSDKSKGSEAGRASREGSAGISKSDHHAKAPSQSPEITNVSDELRAKIRAMLMANL